MNYQSPNLEDSRTSRRKKAGKRAADETFASLDCAGAARTRLIAEELIDQLTRAQIGESTDPNSAERLDHLNISLQLLVPAPTAQDSLATITSTSKEAHKLVRDLEESVTGRRGQRAQRRAESSMRLAALTQNDADLLLKEDRQAKSPEAALVPVKAPELQMPVLAVSPEQVVPVQVSPEQVAPEKVSPGQVTPVKVKASETTGLSSALPKKTRSGSELKSLGSLLKRPPLQSAAEIAKPAAPTAQAPQVKIETAPVTIAPVEPEILPEIEPEINQEIKAEPEQVEEPIQLSSLLPAPPEVPDLESQKQSKSNWKAAKEIAGGTESGALLLNIISEPERAMNDMLRQAKWQLKKWTK